MACGTGGLSSPKLKAEVRQAASGPALFINGKRTVPTIFFVNFDAEESLRPLQLEEIAAAGRHGVDIVSFPLTTPWPKPGEPRDFGEIDRRIGAAIRANPKILILPRLGVTWPPKWWSDEHPDELMLYDDGSRGIASIHSRRWLNDALEHNAALIEYVERKYGDHILGYHPCGQNTGEWFFDNTWEGKLSGLEPPARKAFREFIRAKYRTEAELCKAWGDQDAVADTVEIPAVSERKASGAGAFRNLPAQQNALDFDEFRNQAMADVAERFCRLVRQKAPGKLAVVFYGYHFEVAGAPHGLQSTGHLALARLLKSPNVDIVCSPVSYFDRAAGGGGYFMAPVDSVQLHNKIWLIEDDTRTHLGSRMPGDPIPYTNDLRETRGVLSRNFSHIVTRGAAVWWMDLFGRGWFSGDEIWQYLGGLESCYEGAMDIQEKYQPEIAVIVDEHSCLYLSSSGAITNPLLSLFRQQWYRIGAPVGIYLLEDLPKIPPARMYIFLDTFSLSDKQLASIKRFACRGGHVVVWMYAPGIVSGGTVSPERVQHVTGMALREAVAGDGNIVLANGNKFSAQHGRLDPSFAVADDKAEPLARYASGDAVAVAARNMGDWTSVYSGVLQLPASLLRQLAIGAGVHIYANTNDVISAGNGFVSIHASTAGPKTLNLPQESNVIDCTTGEKLGWRKSLSLEMQVGDTRLLKLFR